MLRSSMVERRPAGTAGMAVARGAVGIFGLKIAYSLLGFSVGIVLARTLGVASYGRYSYAMSWATFLAAPAVLGLDKLVVRQVAADRTRGDWRHFRGLLKAANQAGLVASAVLILIAAILALLASSTGHREAALTVMIALLM